MSRPTKTGLDYYQLDTDIFLDRKVKRLIKAFSGKGYMIFSFVLTEIYRDKGCFIEWDSNTAFDVSDSLNVPENLVNEVIEYCCNVGLFDKELRTNEGILTSESIQKRWEKISKDAKRSVFEVEKIRHGISLIQEETNKLPEVIPKTQEETLKTTVKSTQSKVKESIVNKRREKIKSETLPSSDIRAFDFLQKNYPTRLEQQFNMRYKSKIKSIEDFVSAFNNKVDIEKLEFTDRILFARLDDFARNWVHNQERFNGKGAAEIRQDNGSKNFYSNVKSV